MKKKDYSKLHMTAYHRFQFYWLADHGFTMADIFKAMAECACELAEEGEDIYEGSLRDIFEESGLGSGSLYPCFDEFLDHEYQDSDLMRAILSDEEFRDYSQEMELTSEQLMRSHSHILLETPHGHILATDQDNAEYPGIALSFIPKGENPWEGCYPGCILEYNPTYHGGVEGPELSEAVEKTVLWVYTKDQDLYDEPTASFEME